MKDSFIKRASRVVHAEVEAARAVGRLIKTDNFRRAVDIISLSRGKNVVTTGIGKSEFVARKCSATLTSMGRRSFFLDPVAALHGDCGMFSVGDVIIAFSFSGETKEVLRLIRHARREFRAKIISIVGASTSALVRESDVALVIRVSKEGSPFNLAPMASTTASLVAGDALAAAAISPKHFTPRHFARLHPSGSLGLSLRPIRDVMTERVPVVQSTATVVDAVKESSKKKKGIVGILDSSRRLIGAITDGDVRRIIMTHDDPKKLLARRVMTKNPKTISIESNAQDALRLMEQWKITSLFVVDKSKKIRGLVHMHDVVEQMIL